jgi:hypothetical protein
LRRIVNDYHDGRLAIVAVVIVPVIGWSITSSITESAVAVTQPATIPKSAVAQPATITVAPQSESPVAAQSQPPVSVSQPTKKAEPATVAIEAATVAEAALNVVATATVVDGASIAIAGDDYGTTVDVTIAVELPNGRSIGRSRGVGTTHIDGPRGALIRPEIGAIDVGNWANSTTMTAAVPTAYIMPAAATVSTTAMMTAPMTSSMSAAVSAVTKYNGILKADQEKTCQPA